MCVRSEKDHLFKLTLFKYFRSATLCHAQTSTHQFKYAKQIMNPWMNFRCQFMRCIWRAGPLSSYAVNRFFLSFLIWFLAFFFVLVLRSISRYYHQQNNLFILHLHWKREAENKYHIHIRHKKEWTKTKCFNVRSRIRLFAYFFLLATKSLCKIWIHFCHDQMSTERMLNRCGSGSLMRYYISIRLKCQNQRLIHSILSVNFVFLLSWISLLFFLWFGCCLRSMTRPPEKKTKKICDFC